MKTIATLPSLPSLPFSAAHDLPAAKLADLPVELFEEIVGRMDSLRTVAATAQVCRAWHERLSRPDGLLRQERLQAGLRRKMPTLPCSAQVQAGDLLHRRPVSYEWAWNHNDTDSQPDSRTLEHLQRDLEALRCVKKLDLSELRLSRTALQSTVAFIAIQADACTSLKLPYSRPTWPPFNSPRMKTEELETILTSLTQLKTLRELNLSKMGLRAVPQNLSELTRLTSLNLANNHLSALPEWLPTKLPNLRKLNLTCNQLHSLPATFPTLVHLQELTAAGNPMQNVPADPSEDLLPRHPVVCYEPAKAPKDSGAAAAAGSREFMDEVPRLRRVHFAEHLEAVRRKRLAALGSASV
jgi:Leucine-rich repeat (LRR) protein